MHCDPLINLLSYSFRLIFHILNWLYDGEQIIIPMDANEDVPEGDTHNMFRSLGLRKLILQLHSTLSPPSTHHRNQ